MHGSDLLSLSLGSEGDRSQIEPAYLKDRTCTILRDHIITGRIPPGTKLTERDVAELLEVSRAPARDALMELERQGLVVSKSTGRYVIQLTEKLIRDTYQVRLPLELLAVKLATQNLSAENASQLRNIQRALEESVRTRDLSTHVNADLEMHFQIWKLSGNGVLLDMLGSIIGPTLMFFANNAHLYDWNATVQSHQELTDHIVLGDVTHATKSIQWHVEDSLSRSLRAFEACKG